MRPSNCSHTVVILLLFHESTSVCILVNFKGNLKTKTPVPMVPRVCGAQWSTMEFPTWSIHNGLDPSFWSFDEFHWAVLIQNFGRSLKISKFGSSLSLKPHSKSLSHRMTTEPQIWYLQFKSHIVRIWIFNLFDLIYLIYWIFSNFIWFASIWTSA